MLFPRALHATDRTSRRTFPRLVTIAACTAATLLTLRAEAATADDLALEVPLRFIGTMPAVEVTVNGKGPFLFGIDTGAQGPARIDSAVAEKLGIAPAGERQATDGSNRGPQRMQMVRLETLEIGGLRFADITAGSRSYKSAQRAAELDGVIGLQLLAGYLATIDFPGKKLRLNRGALGAADGREILDYKNEQGVPTILMSVGESTIEARIDSGNGIGAFVLPTATAEKLTQLSEAAVVGKARSLSGEVEIKQVQVKEPIRIGRHEFAEPTITFPALGDVANIGGKALADFVVTFDQANSRVRFIRTASAHE